MSTTAQGAAVSPVTYSIDPTHSSATFAIRHLMIAHARGGFSGVNGSITFDALNPANSKVDASVDATTLLTHDAKRDAHVKGADFLDVEKFPKISFASKRVSANGPNRWQVTGDLTLHGVTREATLDVETADAESKDPWGNLRNGASATTTIKRSDYGLVFNAPLETGGVMLSDEVHIQLDIELIKKQ
jgi:polyisoprenoid-binding protein YceI